MTDTTTNTATDRTADATSPASAGTTNRWTANAPILFGLGILLGGLVIFGGNYNVKPDDNGGLGAAIFSAAVLLVIAAVLYFVVLPRVQHVDRTVIILSVLAILTLAVFWLGVTPIFAAAAVAVAGRAASVSRAALVLEVIAVVAALVSVVGTLAQTNF
jgi:hypothetical protein